MANKQKKTTSKQWYDPDMLEETSLHDPRIIEKKRLPEIDQNEEDWDRRQYMKEKTDDAHKKYQEQFRKRDDNMTPPSKEKKIDHPPKLSPLFYIFVFIVTVNVSFIMMSLGYVNIVSTILVALCIALAIPSILEKKEENP